MNVTRTATNPKFQALSDIILPILQPYKVKRVALFGSVVRGEDRPDSDIDILVSLRPPGERPVDLVTEEGLSPYIRPYVEKEMVILYEAE